MRFSYQFVLFLFGLRWSARAIKAYAMAEVETRKLKYPKVGTEGLLMGILIEGLLQCSISFIYFYFTFSSNSKMHFYFGME